MAIDAPDGLRRKEHGGERLEPLDAPSDALHARVGERPVTITDAATQVGEIKGHDRWRSRRNDHAATAPTSVLVLLTPTNSSGRWDSGAPHPLGLDDGSATLAEGYGTVIQIRVTKG